MNRRRSLKNNSGCPVRRSLTARSAAEPLWHRLQSVPALQTQTKVYATFEKHFLSELKLR